MSLWERRAAQAENEKNGITVRVEGYPGMSFQVRPLCDWNDEYQRAQVAIAQRPEVRDYLERVRKPGYAATETDAALDKAMLRDAFADGCIVGWTGVPAPAGKAKTWPHSRDNARKLLEHFPDIYAALRRTAADIRNFAPKQDAADAIAGN